MPLLELPEPARPPVARPAPDRDRPRRRTVGVALSDVSLTLASPYGSLRRGKLRDNAAEIVAIAARRGAGGPRGGPAAVDGRFGRPGGAGGARLDIGVVGRDPAASRAVGRTALHRGGEPVPDRWGRSQPQAARRGGGSHGRRLVIAKRAGFAALSRGNRSVLFPIVLMRTRKSFISSILSWQIDHTSCADTVTVLHR